MKEQIKFFYNEEQLAIVVDCFSKALGSNPPTINPEGFYCERESFSLATWKSNHGPRDIFSEETEKLIEVICGTFDKLFESNKSAYASHFYLSLELLNALKSLFFMFFLLYFY